MEDKKTLIRVVAGDATIATSSMKSIAPLGTRFGDGRLLDILDENRRHVRQDIVKVNESKVGNK